MKPIFKLLFLLVGICLCQKFMAQTISFNHYIKTVATKNTAYLAEKYNVDIATANLQAARVFNDPELSIGYANNEDWRMLMGQSVEVELSYDINLGGVRKARINAARSEKEVTQATVNAYLCNLRSEACQAWAEAWRLRETCKLLKQTAEEMQRIALSDSLRLSVGDIGRTDAMQSKLEAQNLLQELRTTQADYQNVLLQLEFLMGGEKITQLAEEDLPFTNSNYQQSYVIKMAEENRADLRAAELTQQLSANNLKLVKASRAIDLGLSLGYAWNKEVRNEIAPAPNFNSWSVGVSIPLKFSNTNKGETIAAKHAISQSQQAYESARQQVRMEVAQAFNSYRAAKNAKDNFSNHIIVDAREILDNRTVGYNSGESSLVELLTAHQTYREVMLRYIDVCAQYYISEVVLKQAIGM